MTLIFIGAVVVLVVGGAWFLFIRTRKALKELADANGWVFTSLGPNTWKITGREAGSQWTCSLRIAGNDASAGMVFEVERRTPGAELMVADRRAASALRNLMPRIQKLAGQTLTDPSISLIQKGLEVSGPASTTYASLGDVDTARRLATSEVQRSLEAATPYGLTVTVRANQIEVRTPNAAGPSEAKRAEATIAVGRAVMRALS